MKCECLPRKQRSSPAVDPQQRALHHPQDKCNIIGRRGGWGGREKKEGGGGGKELFCKEMAKLEVPINLTKPGSLRYCQPLQTKQIAGEVTKNQTNRKATRIQQLCNQRFTQAPVGILNPSASLALLYTLRKEEEVGFILE